MKRFGNILLYAILSICPTNLNADEWDPIKQTDFFSASRKHMVNIKPHPNWPDKPGHCRATLFQLVGKTKREIWSRHLINNHAPVRVFVSDSGKFVLTMDEWHRVGELPVVIYGSRGELIRVHSTDSLGLKDDIQHIKRTVSSFWWNENSISFFGPKDEAFITRLHWGKLLFINLRDGDLINEERYRTDKGWLMPEKKWHTMHEYANDQIRMHAMELLGSGNADDRKTGALVCQQEQIKEAVPRLKELLADKEYYTTNVPKEWTRVYYIRKAAKDALEVMGETIGDVVVQEIDN